jgi:hypothetical protein
VCRMRRRHCQALAAQLQMYTPWLSEGDANASWHVQRCLRAVVDHDMTS